MISFSSVFIVIRQCTVSAQPPEAKHFDRIPFVAPNPRGSMGKRKHKNRAIPIHLVSRQETKSQRRRRVHAFYEQDKAPIQDTRRQDMLPHIPGWESLAPPITFWGKPRTKTCQTGKDGAITGDGFGNCFAWTTSSIVCSPPMHQPASTRHAVETCILQGCGWPFVWSIKTMQRQ